MKTQLQIEHYVRQVLFTNRFAVLATESNSKPHASFIAISAADNLMQLYFVTYRNTSKYSNLITNQNVSILFEFRNEENNQQHSTILTAFGKAEELVDFNADTILQSHLVRHPELHAFVLSSNCALFQVNVDAYQMVLGIEDIIWWNINELK